MRPLYCCELSSVRLRHVEIDRARSIWPEQSAPIDADNFHAEAVSVDADNDEMIRIVAGIHPRLHDVIHRRAICQIERTRLRLALIGVRRRSAAARHNQVHPMPAAGVFVALDPMLEQMFMAREDGLHMMC